MAVSRFAIASNKKTAIMKQNMREVAVLLAEEPPREERARIKAEALIRDDNMIEAYEILQLECELLSERIKLLESQKECPPDLVSIISDLIYATPRVDIPELTEIRKQFRAKYGKEFEQAAIENRGCVLNDRVVSKLSIHPPVAYLVQVRTVEMFLCVEVGGIGISADPFYHLLCRHIWRKLLINLRWIGSQQSS